MFVSQVRLLQIGKRLDIGPLTALVARRRSHSRTG